MKTAKTKASGGTRDSYKKPTLRSEAFARAVKKAKLGSVGPGGLRSLFEQGAKKAAALPRHPFKGNWPYIQAMLRLVAAHERGEYRQVPKNDLTWILTALNYLVDPFDLIPDMTPLLGLVDDATVVGFVVDKTQHTLDEFMIWETMGVR